MSDTPLLTIDELSLSDEDIMIMRTLTKQQRNTIMKVGFIQLYTTESPDMRTAIKNFIKYLMTVSSAQHNITSAEGKPDPKDQLRAIMGK